DAAGRTIAAGTFRVAPHRALDARTGARDCIETSPRPVDRQKAVATLNPSETESTSPVTEGHPSAPPEASTIAGEIVAGLLGAGVSLACLLPPILHLVTGPLGPFIGGFVAANRVRPGVRAQGIVATTLATVLSTLVGTALRGVTALAAPKELPDW